MIALALAAALAALIVVFGVRRLLSAPDASPLWRYSLALMLAGLLWAGPSRALGYPPGMADLVFLGGLFVHLTLADPAPRRAN